jgi:HYR domain
MNVIRHATATPFRQALIGFVALIIVGLPATAGATTSSAVAYVTDFGAGSDDPNGPPTMTGSSIFVNALTGIPPHGSYTTTDGTKTISIVDVSVAAIEANPGTALTGFDTIILYQVCGIGSLPNTIGAINSFLAAGGKVLIFDADRCSSLNGLPATYGGFAFPFTSSRLGPKGTVGAYTNVQPSTLTTGLALGPQSDDAIADANILSTLDGAWCGSITATSTTGTAGFVQAYARTPNGGLVIYEGEDFWLTVGPAPHLRQVFDLMLQQDWNPDGLACALPGSGIALGPVTQRVVPGEFAGLMATVVDANGIPQRGIVLTFEVRLGPSAGTGGSNETDAAGHAAFLYRTVGEPGMDTADVSFVDGHGLKHVSNTASVVLAAANTPPVARCTDVTVPTSPRYCAAPASVDNGSFDPDPGDAITVSQSPGAPYRVGTTAVTLTVTDSAGASSTCTATVTVLDSEPPKLTCPAPISVECTSQQSAAASFAATAQDNCGAAIVSCPASGTRFPLGTTAVTCTATDTANNTGRCTSSVTVVDTRPPTVSCVAGVNPSGSNILASDAGFYTVSAADGCSAATISFGGIELRNGETIKITQSPGQSGVSLNNTMGPLAIKHFLVGPGAAAVMATDATGNVATTLCSVPPASN